MRCKTFVIRINHDYTDYDESRLNEFIDDKRVERLAAEVIPGDPPCWSIVVFYEEKGLEFEEPYASEYQEDAPMDELEKGIFEALTQWRRSRAEKEGVLPYIISPNACLKQIARMKPAREEDLLAVIGFGERRAKKYSKEILPIVREIVEGFGGG